MSTIAESIAEYQKDFKKSPIKKNKRIKKVPPGSKQKKTFQPLFVPKSSIETLPKDMTIDGVKIIRTKGLEKQTYTYKKTGTDVSQERLQQALGYWDQVMEWLLDYGDQDSVFQTAFDNFLAQMPK